MDTEHEKYRVHYKSEPSPKKFCNLVDFVNDLKMIFLDLRGNRPQ